jgi:hypothetical protein
MASALSRGTPGQLKILETLIEGFYAIPNCPGAPIPADVLQKYAQVILEKQELDILTGYCVRLTALGLLKRGRSTTIVTDAVQNLSREDSARTIEEAAKYGSSIRDNTRSARGPGDPITLKTLLMGLTDGGDLTA